MLAIDPGWRNEKVQAQFPITAMDGGHIENADACANFRDSAGSGVGWIKRSGSTNARPFQSYPGII